MKPLTDKKYLAIVITIALLLRLLTILISNNNALIYDEVEYYQIATNLAQGQGYSTAEGPTAFRPPAYPVFLAAIQSIYGNNQCQHVLAIKIVQAIIGMFLVIIMYLVSKEIFNNKISRLAALFTALNPSLIAYTAALMTENLFIPFFCAAILCTLRALNRKNKTYTYLAGALFGLAILSRPSSAAFLPVLFIGIHIRRSWKQSLPQIITIFIIAAVFITPWVIRNNMISEEHVIIDTRTGYNLYMGYNPEATGRYDQRAADFLKTIPDESERNSWAMSQAFRFIAEKPIQSISLIPKKFMYFWELDRRDFISKLSHNAVGPFHPWQIYFFFFLIMGSFAFLVIFSIIGIVFSEKRMIWLALSIISYYTLLHSLTFGDSRLHLVLVPFLAILSSKGIYSIKRIRSGLKSKDTAKRSRTIKKTIIFASIIALFISMWIYGIIHDIPLFNILLSEGGNLARIPY